MIQVIVLTFLNITATILHKGLESWIITSTLNHKEWVACTRNNPKSNIVKCFVCDKQIKPHIEFKDIEGYWTNRFFCMDCLHNFIKKGFCWKGDVTIEDMKYYDIEEAVSQETLKKIRECI